MFRTEYQKGDKIGVLTFVRRAEGKPGKPMAVFLCDCGKELTSRIDSAQAQRTKSCGCKTKEFLSKAGTKHPPVEYISSGVKKMPRLFPEDVKRFWSKVNCDSNLDHCWEWKSNGERYGHFRVGKAEYKSNRVAYWLWYGVDPSDLSVAHTCDNSKCCNHTHLFLASHDENMNDMAEKGRANPHALDEFKVLQIRKLHEEGVSKFDLAIKFDVNINSIYSVVNRHSWKHI